MIANAAIADVAELADALDLGSSTARCEGSSPFVRINSKISQRLSHSSPTLYIRTLNVAIRKLRSFSHNHVVFRKLMSLSLIGICSQINVAVCVE